MSNAPTTGEGPEALGSSAAPIPGEGHDALHIVFDGPPSHEGPRFIEVETPEGRSINAGEWRERPDGYWELVIGGPASPSPLARELEQSAIAMIAATQQPEGEGLRPLGQRMRSSEEIVRGALCPGDASVFLDGLSRHHLQMVLAQAWVDGAAQGRAIERSRALPPAPSPIGAEKQEGGRP